MRCIYEDDYLLVLDKPPGLVVDFSNTATDETLADILKKDFNIQLPRGGIVHRLDKDTSGILLVAKTPKALENLQSQFKERLVQKEYLALVHGLIAEPGRVDGAIARNPENREKFTVISPGRSLPRLRSGQESPPSRWFTPAGWQAGRQAVTEYEPMEKCQMSNVKCQMLFAGFNKIQLRKLQTMNYQLFTLLRCKPKTGRTHQIRVHLKYINHPIVADEKYAGRKMYRLDKRWCPRIFLHAAKIGFRHPATGEWMKLESELPEDLTKAIEYLKCQNSNVKSTTQINTPLLNRGKMF